MMTFERWIKGLAVLAGLGLLAAGLGIFHFKAQHSRRKAQEEISTVVRLRAGQVAAWRARCLADAAFVGESPLFRAVVSQWLANRSPEGARELLTQFKSFAQNYRYSDVLLVDSKGAVALGLTGAREHFDDEAARDLAAALRDRKPVLTELNEGSGGLPPHLDVISPIVGTPGGEPLGAVVLQSNAQEHLYPFINNWPCARDTAETLLVRRDGTDTLFLNALRFRKGTPLTVRLPLDRVDAPAVMAVSGTEGVVRGIDYRGVDVLAVLQKIPDSPWVLVGKMDIAEAYADSRRESVILLALMFVIAWGGVGTLLFLWLHNDMAEEEEENRKHKAH